MGKEHVLAKGHIPSLTPEAADPAKAFRGWGKVPGLIELTVIGDVCLGDDCLNLPIVQGCCAIIQPSVPGKGQPHKYQHAGAGRGLCQLGQTGQRALPQGLLPKKVVTGIPCEAQLRQGQNPHAQTLGLRHGCRALLGIVSTVGYPEGYRCSGYFNKSILHLHSLTIWPPRRQITWRYSS